MIVRRSGRSRPSTGSLRGGTMNTGLEVRGLLDRLQQAAWELAALAIAVRGVGVADGDLLDSARLVLKELGLMSPTPNGARPVPGLEELIAEGGSNFASE